MTRTARLLAPALFGFCAMLGVSVARADGEAGVVIQHGDGNVDTYCVPFKGDSINGADLLKSVNIPVERVGELVCAVGNNPAEGCFGASDYDSCTCECSGSKAATCTYWAYFTQPYGQSWAYSGLSFSLSKAKDGDMQAWRWGKGGPSNAPPPPAISFEAVCGHAPRGGLAQSTQPPIATATNTVAAPATATSAITAAISPTVLVTLTATATAAASATAAQTAEPSSTVSVTITSHGTATATPAPSVATTSTDSSGGKGSLVLFGAVAAVMLATIGASLVWRHSHGR